MVILAVRVQEIEISGACSTGSGGFVSGPIQPNARAFGWDWGASLSRILTGAIPAHKSLGKTARPTWFITFHDIVVDSNRFLGAVKRKVYL